MKKAKFDFHVIGNQENPKVLLVHGMGFYWQRCFAPLMEELKTEYCLIVPELPGHRQERERGFPSVLICAEYIEDYLQAEGFTELAAVYGISLGASIAVEIALRGRVEIDKLVADGGQYESMGLLKALYAVVMAWQFRRVIKGKHMISSVRENMGYLNQNDIDVLQPLCCTVISFSALYRSALAAYSYDITDRSETLDLDVTIAYGENEVYAKASADILNRLCEREVRIAPCQGMGHAEALSKDPSWICTLIREQV